MGRKKRARALLDALEGLFEHPPSRKRLLKARHLEEFVGQMKERRAELVARFDQETDEAASVEIAADIAVLDEQLVKAQKLLDKLRDG